MSEYGKEFGEQGEDIACSYLKNKGLKWVASNFRSKWGEVDLVMRDGRFLVFVEVKRRRDNHFGEPEEAVTKTKRAHMVKSALYFLQKSGREDECVRFDVVSVGTFGVRHFPDAFSVEENFYY